MQQIFEKERLKFAGMSDYQHAYQWAGFIGDCARDIQYGNSVGSAAVNARRYARLIACAARRAEGDKKAELVALAIKEMAIARRCRIRAIAKDRDGYNAALYCAVRWPS